LEAAQCTDPILRKELLETLAEIAGENLALPLPAEGLRKIAEAHASGARMVDWGDMKVTRFFRHADTVDDSEAADVRQYLLAQEATWTSMHAQATERMRPVLKELGGANRWTSPAEFIEECWTDSDFLSGFIEPIWEMWGFPAPAPVEDLLKHQAWRLFFDGLGASVYAKHVAHPQLRKVQEADLEQLVYLGHAQSRVFASEDVGFRDLANAILRGRYDQAEVVPLDALIS